MRKTTHQQQRPHRETPPPPPPIAPMTIGGFVSAVTVVIILLLLGIMLTNRSNELAARGIGQPISHQDASPMPPTIEPFPDEETTPITNTDQITDTLIGDTSGTKQWSAPPPMVIDPNARYVATITTPRGDIVVRLRPDIAPQTVNNFVFLARQGFYDGLTWHRVIEGFMAQGGDPTGTGMGGAGYTIPAEFSDAILFDRPGILAMARSQDPDSASSQFFITTGAAPWLNNQYTAFGEVIEGQDIVNGIPLRDPDTATTPGEIIERITISEEE